MSGFSGILGHEVPIGLLQRLMSEERLPHALLFHGPVGVGKSTVARALAATLFCENPRNDDACGNCDACRLVEAGNHPDRSSVRRLPKKDKPAELRRNIIIEQIRDLSHLASLAPRTAPRRLFVIDPADRINVAAQNALLKTLEEPPGKALLILIAARPHVLLATIRSRCFAVGFSPHFWKPGARPLLRLTIAQGGIAIGVHGVVCRSYGDFAPDVTPDKLGDPDATLSALAVTECAAWRDGCPIAGLLDGQPRTSGTGVDLGVANGAGHGSLQISHKSPTIM